MDPAGPGPVAGPGRIAQCGHLGGNLVRGDRHDAVAAEDEDRQGPGVVAGQDGNIWRPVATDPGDLLERSARLLHGDDPRMVRQA